MLHQVWFDVRTSCSPVQAAPATYCTQHPRDAYGHMSARNDGAGMRRETLEAERVPSCVPSCILALMSLFICPPEIAPPLPAG